MLTGYFFVFKEKPFQVFALWVVLLPWSCSSLLVMLSQAFSNLLMFPFFSYYPKMYEL